MEKIKSILISQPPPKDKTHYHELAEKNNLKIDFRPFIHVEGVSVKEIRKERINILDHTAVIMTSRNAVDHFFRVCEDMRITVPDSMKYFCVSQSVANYLQKYIVYRKRKIFYGDKTFESLFSQIKKNHKEKFFIPLSDMHNNKIPELLKQHKIHFTKSVFYKTVCSDLSDLKDVFYDILVFFSPTGIKSLFANFPDFTQNSTKIATFGKTTQQAAEDAGLRVDIAAPNPESPSMVMALDKYIREFNKSRK